QGPLERRARIANVAAATVGGSVHTTAHHLEEMTALALLGEASARSRRARHRESPEEWMERVGLVPPAPSGAPADTASPTSPPPPSGSPVAPPPPAGSPVAPPPPSGLPAVPPPPSGRPTAPAPPQGDPVRPPAPRDHP